MEPNRVAEVQPHSKTGFMIAIITKSCYSQRESADSGTSPKRLEQVAHPRLDQLKVSTWRRHHPDTHLSITSECYHELSAEVN